MIVSFTHRGLERFFRKGTTSGIHAQHTRKIERILHALDNAEQPKDTNIPGFKLHQLKGNRRNIWAVSVNANWRITFSFKGQNAHTVNYEDYH